MGHTDGVHLNDRDRESDKATWTKRIASRVPYYRASHRTLPPPVPARCHPISQAGIKAFFSRAAGTGDDRGRILSGENFSAAAATTRCEIEGFLMPVKREAVESAVRSLSNFNARHRRQIINSLRG